MKFLKPYKLFEANKSIQSINFDKDGIYEFQDSPASIETPNALGLKTPEKIWEDEKTIQKIREIVDDSKFEYINRNLDIDELVDNVCEHHRRVGKNIRGTGFESILRELDNLLLKDAWYSHRFYLKEKDTGRIRYNLHIFQFSDGYYLVTVKDLDFSHKIWPILLGDNYYLDEIYPLAKLIDRL